MCFPWISDLHRSIFVRKVNETKMVQLESKSGGVDDKPPPLRHVQRLGRRGLRALLSRRHRSPQSSRLSSLRRSRRPSAAAHSRWRRRSPARRLHPPPPPPPPPPPSPPPENLAACPPSLPP